MIPLTLGEIAELVDGVVDPSAAEVVVSREAFVDSRAPVPGGLFVAIAGERVDGHVYADQAVAGGAAAVIGSRATAAPTVVVPDVLAALAVLGREVVRRAAPGTVIGVTGSQGKTSTKDLLGSVLSTVAPTVAAYESQNNELGVPLTALRVTPETRYVVSEMGARGLGHIAFLADIMAPSVGVVLNVGKAHLGEFGSRDGIAAAKGELVEALPADGLAVLNADDPRVLAMASRTSAQVRTFGYAEHADLRVELLGMDDHGRPTIRWHWEGSPTEVPLRYVGAHQVSNAAAAAAACLGLGLPASVVASGLAAAEPSSHWRMEITTSPDGVVVVNDAYNANPDSVRAAVLALLHLAHQRSPARTVAVLGEMRELGDASRAEHEGIGRFVAGLAVDRLVVVGEDARAVFDAARREAGWLGVAQFVEDRDQALAVVRDGLQPGDVVLVKASRATGLEGLAAALAAGTQPTTGQDGGR